MDWLQRDLARDRGASPTSAATGLLCGYLAPRGHYAAPSLLGFADCGRNRLIDERTSMIVAAGLDSRRGMAAAAATLISETGLVANTSSALADSRWLLDATTEAGQPEEAEAIAGYGPSSADHGMASRPCATA